MAKGTLNGILQGKLGNTVFYKVTNSNNKEKQGSRLYVPTVSNPRTAPQANQRMRMKPAINFYRGLADLLDHSWEGVKYGALSRQKFMSLALSPTVQNIPFVDKGESRFIPGDYPLSLGSVGVNTQDLEQFPSGNYESVNWNLLSLMNADDFETFGEYSQGIIDASQGSLRDGDEITVIFVFEKDGFYLPFHSYVVLDATSSLNADLVWGRAGFTIDSGGQIGRFLQVDEDGGEFIPSAETGTLVAYGIIVSRHPSRTSTTWLRSTSSLVCTDAFKAMWMSAERYSAAVLTYRDSATELTSDWLLNQAGSDVGNIGGGSNGGLIQGFVLENRSIRPNGLAGNVDLAYYNDGTIEGFICQTASYQTAVGNVRVVTVTSPKVVNGRNIESTANHDLPYGTKVIAFDTNPSIRTKIAAYYNFVDSPIVEQPGD